MLERAQDRLREAININEDAAHFRLLEYAAALEQAPLPQMMAQQQERQREELLTRALMTERGLQRVAENMRGPVAQAGQIVAEEMMRDNNEQA